MNQKMEVWKRKIRKEKLKQEQERVWDALNETKQSDFPSDMMDILTEAMSKEITAAIDAEILKSMGVKI